MRLEDTKARTVYVKFDLGDTVFQKLATDRWAGMVTGWNVRPDGIKYEVSWQDASSSEHYDIELTNTFVEDYDAENSDD